MYDQVVKCQRAGLCLSEHFLIIIEIIVAICLTQNTVIEYMTNYTYIRISNVKLFLNR